MHSTSYLSHYVSPACAAKSAVMSVVNGVVSADQRIPHFWSGIAGRWLHDVAYAERLKCGLHPVGGGAAGACCRLTSLSPYGVGPGVDRRNVAAVPANHFAMAIDQDRDIKTE